MQVTILFESMAVESVQGEFFNMAKGTNCRRSFRDKKTREMPCNHDRNSARFASPPDCAALSFDKL